MTYAWNAEGPIANYKVKCPCGHKYVMEKWEPLCPKCGKCVNREHHDDPNGLVVVGETFIGFKDEKGKPKHKNTDRVIKYKDWDGRCRVCWPREEKE